ncbi:hypothetical protein AAFF_G00353030 [Aldrovandia affinis]|uniref:Uncharacterized protein n=1 Tax=Aldrovandia affinis TaxID=143900 RepID=A0AAD7SJ09_9TELE|nr:hypothetical protein AAFF_G00353030 [Aldrovandia affinis]
MPPSDYIIIIIALHLSAPEHFQPITRQAIPGLPPLTGCVAVASKFFGLPEFRVSLFVPIKREGFAHLSEERENGCRVKAEAPRYCTPQRGAAVAHRAKALWFGRPIQTSPRQSPPPPRLPPSSCRLTCSRSPDIQIQDCFQYAWGFKSAVASRKKPLGRKRGCPYNAATVASLTRLAGCSRRPSPDAAEAAINKGRRADANPNQEEKPEINGWYCAVTEIPRCWKSSAQLMGIAAKREELWMIAMVTDVA